jgi:hypothetical protein
MMLRRATALTVTLLAASLGCGRAWFEDHAASVSNDAAPDAAPDAALPPGASSCRAFAAAAFVKGPSGCAQ